MGIPSIGFALTGSDHPRLTPTARVILAMIAGGRTSGYEIKQLVDKATRHFWAASYGQIYPELRRLEERGLIRGQADPAGGRARMRYALTREGEDALDRWLTSTAEPGYELRDEGMLKLFFSDLDVVHRAQHVDAIRRREQRTLAQLEALQAQFGAHMRPGQALTLELGIEIKRATLRWCEGVIAGIEA